MRQNNPANRAQATVRPAEYFLIESQNPKISGLNGAIKSYVDYLYAIA